jgi:hypothetical protein
MLGQGVTLVNALRNQFTGPAKEVINFYLNIFNGRPLAALVRLTQTGTDFRCARPPFFA